ncbi:hypothetical protein ACP4OV_010490 [Aristida adscensionis]
MASRHGNRRTKAEQWLFGGKWRGTAKETRHPVVSEVNPPNPITTPKNESICLEKSRVHLPGLEQREIIDIMPVRKSMSNPFTTQKDEGMCLEKSRVHLTGPGQREIIDVVPGRKSMSNSFTTQKGEDIFLEKSRVHLAGLGQREIVDVAPGRKSMSSFIATQKDEGICLEKSRVHLPGLGQREIMDVMPGRKSMPEMEINIKEAVAVLGVRVMAADMPPFMQLHAFRCAKRSYDSLDKFSSRQLAHDVKKEFDKVYGPTWHCIVGTSYGSFVTHSRGGFLYFSMDKIIVMLFKTKIRKVLAS